jgi:acyl-CoA hydrolase
MTLTLTSSEQINLHQLAENTFREMDGHIIMGVPIGIGKAPNLLNAFYDVAKENPQFRLDIHTALTLTRPRTRSDLEKRLLEPFFDRQFAGIAEYKFADAALKQQLPSNISVVQFYFKAGEMLRNTPAQLDALSTNYTHVVRDMMNRGINVFTQAICKKVIAGKTRYSLSSNPDVTLDLQRMMREQSHRDGKKRLALAEVNNELPFMPNDAEISNDLFDIIIDHESMNCALFAIPQQPISATDHMIGFYTSTLVKDAGTLQIGIGSLGDAVTNALLVRHNKNSDYQSLLRRTQALEKFPVIQSDGDTAPFDQGLYGNTEMLVPGYLELKRGGILKRKVYHDLTVQQLLNEGLQENRIGLDWLDALMAKQRISSPLTAQDLSYLQHWGLISAEASIEGSKLLHAGEAQIPDLKDPTFRQWCHDTLLGKQLNHGILIDAGFFVGSQHFYDTLKQMPDDELHEINMTSVDFTNHLHGGEALRIAQRRHARFINACMKMTLSGAAVSDALEDGQVVSGVGGQFNFVSMAHEIPQARSILMMRSCRHKRGKPVSNIVFNYGHTTIPKHLRDIVVTEYGIADLRSKNDQEIIIELLKIADSRFQDKLIRQAQKAGKLSKKYRLPEAFRNNTSSELKQALAENLQTNFLPFPFGKELTDQEVLIGGSLQQLLVKLGKPWQLLGAILKTPDPEKVAANRSNLERMRLSAPKTLKDRLMRRLLLSVLPYEPTSQPEANVPD